MKRKDKHINKFLHDPLPDPEIPADDAWAGMSNMLATGSAQGATGQSQFSNVWKAIARFKVLLIGVSVVVTSAVVVLIVFNTERKDDKYTENQSINSKIKDSATVRKKLKTSALRADKEHIGAVSTLPGTASSRTAPSKSTPSETTQSDTSRYETTTTSTSPSVTTPHEASQTTVAGNPDPVSSTKSAISEKGHITVKSKQPMSLSAGSSRARTGAAQARTTDTRADVREHANDTPSRPISEQINTGFLASTLNTSPTALETISSVSPENNGPAAPRQMSLNSLEPLAGHFKSVNNDLSKLVKKQELPYPSQPTVKTRSVIWQNIHFGPEWNINRSIASTNYMFTGADSVKRAARLAIPGVFVSKNWNRHTATFIFTPLHSYFGDKERVAQRVDTVHVSDSLVYRTNYNTYFIKAFGLNFSIQYQYRATSLLSLVGGLSYARYSAALFRKETEYSAGTIINEGHLTAKGRDALKPYIRPRQWSIRVGVLSGSPQVLNGRLQFGINVIIPVSNLSLDGFESAKSPNVQGSIRFLLK